MSVLQERPRVAAATAVAVLVVVIAAMLVGGAITADGDAPPAPDQRATLAQAKQRAAALERELAGARTGLRAQAAGLQTSTTSAKRWRQRALRAERQLKAPKRAERKRARGRRR